MYRKSLIFISLSVLGFLIGSMIARTDLLAIAAVLGMLVLGLSIFKVEYLFYFIVLFLILSATEPPSGSIFEYLTVKKFPGVPAFFELLVAVLILAFFARLVLLKEKVAVSLLRFPVIIFFSLLGVSFAVGWQNGADEILFKEDFKKYFIPVLFLICSLNILNSDRRIRFLFVSGFIVAAIKSSLGSIYYMKGYGFEYGDMKTVFNASGDFIPLVTAILAGVSLIIHKKISGGKLLLLTLGMFPMLFAVVFSFRRNTWLGILLSLILLFSLAHGKRKVKMVTVAMCVALAVFLLISSANLTGTMPSEKFMKERFYSIFDKEQDSNVAHYVEWQVTLADIERHPILGLGLGSERSLIRGYESLNRHTIHNAFIMLWMKMGIFSLALFMYYLIRYLIFGVRAARAKKEYDLKALQIGLISTFGYWAVALNVGPSWHYYQETCLIAVVAAAAVNLSRLRDRVANGAEVERIQAGAEARAGI